MRRQSIFDDRWWLEYMEMKIGKSRRALSGFVERQRGFWGYFHENLLQISSADRGRLKKLEKLRRLIKESDDVAMPEDGHFYEALHDKIMAAAFDDAVDIDVTNRRVSCRTAQWEWPGL